jgi:hypothetical protein
MWNGPPVYVPAGCRPVVDSLRVAGRAACQKTINIAVGFVLGFLNLTLVLANYANMVYEFGFRNSPCKCLLHCLSIPARS